MIPRPFPEIGATDLDALCTEQVQEGRTIEYKLATPGNSDGDKKEFLADISSLANSSGGDLLFGIKEDGGVPTAIEGISVADADAEVRRLDSILASGIEPRIRYHIRIVDYTLEKKVLIIRVDRSRLAPHRVVFKSHDKFYARNSAGKYPLDVSELRDAFLSWSALGERIQGFRRERLALIGGGHTPLRLLSGGYLVLHLVPLDAFATATEYDFLELHRNPHLLKPINAHGWNHRINVDGVVTFTPEQEGALNYTQLFRNGIIEAVDASLVRWRHEGRLVIPSASFEEQVITSTGAYLNVLHHLGVAPPVYVFVSIVNASGTWLGVADSFYDLHDRVPLDRDVLSLPEVSVEEYGIGLAALLKPVFDTLWNAFGYPGSRYYDESGQRKSR